MYVHPSGWTYYHNPRLRLVTDFSMGVALGQDEYKHAQEETGGEDEVVPEGWEKLIDSGTTSKIDCTWFLGLINLITGIVATENLYVNHSQRRAMCQKPNPDEKIGEGYNSDHQSRSNEDWDEGENLTLSC
jgi:hypothetical protein